jgi:hypothetical protein
MFVNGIDLAATRLIHEYLSKSDAAMRVAQLRVLGGAMARVPADATALAHRSKPMLVNVAAFYQGDAEREVRRVWVNEFANALQSRDEGAYVGFLTDDGQARIRSAYPGATWDRLARIKAAYDPTNLFRLNQNFSPATKWPGAPLDLVLPFAIRALVTIPSPALPMERRRFTSGTVALAWCRKRVVFPSLPLLHRQELPCNRVASHCASYSPRPHSPQAAAFSWLLVLAPQAPSLTPAAERRQSSRVRQIRCSTVPSQRFSRRASPKQGAARRTAADSGSSSVRKGSTR